MKDDAPYLLAKWGATRLVGDDCRNSSPVQPFGEMPGGGRLAASLRPLESDEAPPHTGGATLENTNTKNRTIRPPVELTPPPSHDPTDAPARRATFASFPGATFVRQQLDAPVGLGAA